MRGYNDYVITVRRWLKNYNRFGITIENLKDDIKCKEQEMEHDVNAPISHYGNAPVGGASELNIVESSASKHIAMRKEIDDTLSAIADIELVMRKIDRAISGLNDIDRRLVEGHYIKSVSWEELGSEMYYSEKWARERAGKAVREIAIMIFGPKAAGNKEVQLQFIFAR